MLSKIFTALVEMNRKLDAILEILRHPDFSVEDKAVKAAAQAVAEAKERIPSGQGNP